MPENNKEGIDIGSELVKKLYANASFQTKEVQPYYILHRDTIKSFFYEIYDRFGIGSRILGYAGILATLFTVICTATFSTFYGIDGKIILGIMICLSFLVAALMIKDFIKFKKCKGKLSVDNLVDELSSKGSEISGSL